MIEQYLTPLERSDLKATIGTRFTLWLEVWSRVFVLLIGIRFFIHLPEIFWTRIGYICLLIGAYFSFLILPNLVYNLISKRVQDNTFEFERILPYPITSFVWGKFKVILLAVALWAGPFILVGIICKFNIMFVHKFLADAYRLPSDNEIPGLALFILTVTLYGTLWVMTTFMMIRYGFIGPPLLALYGRLLFWLFIILVGFSSFEVIIADRTDLRNYTYILNMIFIALGGIGITYLVIKLTEKKMASLG